MSEYDESKERLEKRRLALDTIDTLELGECCLCGAVIEPEDIDIFDGYPEDNMWRIVCHECDEGYLTSLFPRKAITRTSRRLEGEE